MRGRILMGAAVLIAVAGAIAAPARAATVPAGFEDRSLVSGLDFPIAVAWAPDGRMFVAEHAGRVRVVTAAGNLVEQPLLDITDHTNKIIDQGILGLAADSDFEVNHYLWVLYVFDPNPSDAYGAKTARLVRVVVNPDNTLANPGSPETVVLGKVGTGPCPAPANTVDCINSGWSHTVGTVRAAADGTLWVGAGDAGQPFLADDETSYSGKILHVDRAGRGVPGHPFCAGDGDLSHVCTKIYAKGFRNPFRFTIRPQGGLVAGDVGDETEDEVDFVRPGRDYGWPCYEGAIRSPRHGDDTRCTGPGGEYAKEGTPDAAVPPVHSYQNRPEGAAAIGGPTYTGQSFPAEYDGDVFFGDYVKGYVKRLRLDQQGNVTAVESFATGWEGVDLEVAPWGDLVYADLLGGEIRAISYSPSNRTPVVHAAADPPFGDAPLTVRFSSEGSTDPDGDSLIYDWQFGDGESSSEANPEHTYTDGKYTARLTISDGHGRSATKTLVVSAGNAPPTATIAAPVDGGTFQVGQTVSLSGSATDIQDGDLDDEALSWSIRLHHANHVHPFGPFTGHQASFVAVDDHDADSYYEVRLTATNSRGLTDTDVATIRPRTVQLTLDSIPAGAFLTYSGTSLTAPSTRTAATGFRTSISADDRLMVPNGLLYQFAVWTDGGARDHSFTVPGSARRIAAVYGEDKAADRPASASTYHTGVEPAKAVDGLAGTRWTSAPVDPETWPQWWQVDLGAVRSVNQIWVDWDADYASQYRVATSTDGTNFTTVATVNISQPGRQATTWATRNARYVRVTGLHYGPGAPISIREASVFGPADNLAPEDKAAGRPASAATSNGTDVPGRAVDASSGTRWLSKPYPSQWWQVDLGRSRWVDRVALNWDSSAWCSKYDFATSTDGTSFTVAGSATIAVPGWNTNGFPAKRGRYLRVTCTKASTFNGMGLWDARVFGPAD